MFPGFGYGGISKEDALSLTYPQFKAIMKSLDTDDSKDDDEPTSAISDASINDLIKRWRQEKKEDANN